jgi:hypothetical protein
MTIEKVLLELPAGKRFLAEKAREIERDLRREYVLRVLQQRFSVVLEDLAAQLLTIQEQATLEKLFKLSVTCPDLETFRSALNKP